MKFVIQRVTRAKVTEGDTVLGEIGKGYLVLIGIGEEDNEEVADKLVRKMINLRIFDDENGKTNLSLADVGGELLLVSQFTLYADCRKGNRPSFFYAAKPEKAVPLYEYIIRKCKEAGPKTECGRFGAVMQIDLVNSGPFTVVLDSRDL